MTLNALTRQSEAGQGADLAAGAGRRRLADVFTYAVLAIWALTTIYPFIWVILNSFKVRGEIRRHTFSIPMGESFTLENYELANDRSDFLNAYINSILISGLVTVAVILIAGLCAYGLVRYQFKLKPLLYGLLIASMMFPVFSTIIPVFQMEASWGLASPSVHLGLGRELDQLMERALAMLSVILPQIAGNIAFSTIVLMGFIKSLPIEIEESAYLDGCNVFKIYFKMIIPMARPSFATVAIFAFLWSYNDLFTQMFFLRKKQFHTITLLLNEINSQAGTNYGLMAAGIVLIVVPVLAVYIALQKNIVKGLTAGAVKG
jgi:raffinose/stachyose/melibiose transport system permease protein